MREGKDFTLEQQRLRQFLAANSQPAEILWSFFEDYIWDGRILYFSQQERSRNLCLTKAIYDDNVNYPFGVDLRLVTVCDATSLCSIVAPRSEREAELAMISGTKLSIPTRLPIAHLVADPSEWSLLIPRQSASRGGSPVDELMHKGDLIAIRNGPRSL
jgi:hypothetical protein